MIVPGFLLFKETRLGREVKGEPILVYWKEDQARPCWKAGLRSTRAATLCPMPDEQGAVIAVDANVPEWSPMFLEYLLGQAPSSPAETLDIQDPKRPSLRLHGYS